MVESDTPISRVKAGITVKRRQIKGSKTLLCPLYSDFNGELIQEIDVPIEKGERFWASQGVTFYSRLPSQFT